MILVDTSVWIEHLRAGSDRLKTLLLDEQVLCHPFIVGELACGTLQNRREILSMLRALPEAQLVGHDEVLSFLEGRRLYGHGIGWVDAHLLASTLFTGCALWTLDKPLRTAAAALNVSV
ncbi:MAG: ribonuclease [Deltaproteobacteria bacterium RIFCSPLOWO2_12_FULL_60_19]|nr:MAG: ribonuclease [Deltaproteobacteria bacterium RIFCSPLOWO2_12_FULL_60_19]